MIDYKLTFVQLQIVSVPPAAFLDPHQSILAPVFLQVRSARQVKKKKSTKEKEQEKQEEKDATNFRPPNPIDIQTPLCPLRLLHRGGGLGAKVAVDVQPGRVAAVQRRLERRDARAQGRVLEDAAAAAADGRVLGHEAVGAALDVLGRVAVAVRSGEKLGWECGCGEGESGPDEEAGGIHRGGVGLWTRFTGWRLSSEFGDFLIR